MKSQDRRVVSEMIAQEISKLNLTTSNQEPAKLSSTADNILKFIPLLISATSLALSLSTCNTNASQWAELNDAKFQFEDIILLEDSEMEVDSLSLIKFDVASPLYLVDASRNKVIFYYSLAPVLNNEDLFVPPGTITLSKLSEIQQQRKYPITIPVFKIVKLNGSIKNYGNTSARKVHVKAYMNSGGGWIQIKNIPEFHEETDRDNYYHFTGELRLKPEQRFYDSVKMQIELQYITASGQEKKQILAGAFVTKTMRFSKISPQLITNPK